MNNDNTNSTTTSSSSSPTKETNEGNNMGKAHGITRNTRSDNGPFNAGGTQVCRLPPEAMAVSATESNLSDEVVLAAAATVAAMAAPKRAPPAAIAVASSNAARKRPPPTYAAAASEPANKKTAKTCKASATRKTSSAEERWEDMFTRLLRYKHAHGSCQVPNRYEKDPKLGAWVSTQRRHYRVAMKDKIESSSLTNDRIRRLEEAGFEWTGINPRYLHWDMRMGELTEFKERFGHVNIPINWPENVKLANWTSTQRQEYKNKLKGKKSRLDDRRIELLNKIGFAWELQRGGRKRQLVAATPGGGQQEEEEHQEGEHAEEDDDDSDDEQSDQASSEAGDESYHAEEDPQDLGANRNAGSVAVAGGQSSSEDEEEDSKPSASEISASATSIPPMLSVGGNVVQGHLGVPPGFFVQRPQPPRGDASVIASASAAEFLPPGNPFGVAEAAPSPTLPSPTLSANNETLGLLLSLAQQYQSTQAGVQSQATASRAFMQSHAPAPPHSFLQSQVATPPLHPQPLPTGDIRATLNQLAAFQSVQAQAQVQAQAAITAYNNGRITGILEAMQQQQNGSFSQESLLQQHLLSAPSVRSTVPVPSGGRILSHGNLSLIQRLAFLQGNQGGLLNAHHVASISDSSSSAGHASQPPSLLNTISNQVYTDMANIHRARAEGAGSPTVSGNPNLNGRDPNRGDWPPR